MNLSIRLNQHRVDQLVDAANKRDIAMAALVKKLIDDFLEGETSAKKGKGWKEDSRI